MRPIEMEHTGYAWELQAAAMPVRSSGAKSMRGGGAADGQPADAYFLQRLVKYGRSACEDTTTGQRDRGTAGCSDGIQERTSGVSTGVRLDPLIVTRPSGYASNSPNSEPD